MNRRTNVILFLLTFWFVYKCTFQISSISPPNNEIEAEINHLLEMDIHQNCKIKTFTDFDPIETDIPSTIAYEQTVEMCTLPADYMCYSTEFHGADFLNRYHFYLKNGKLIIAYLQKIEKDKELDLKFYFDQNEKLIKVQPILDKTHLYIPRSEELAVDNFKEKIWRDYQKTRAEFE